MRRSATVVALLMAGLPVFGADQPKDKKDKKDKKAAAAPAAVDPLADADAKIAAGDLDGAAEALARAASAPGATGEPSLRLGRVREQQSQLDVAIDAYKAAAAKLTGPAQGEALGRMAVLQQIRGMGEAAATAQAAAAADPEGVWPTIALARLRAKEGQGDEAKALALKAAASGGGAAQSALGAAEEARADLPAAEAAYRKALESADQKILATIGLARVLRKTGRAAEAEPMLREVLAEAPGAVDAYKESARVKLALRRPREAMEDAATAAALGEGDQEAQHLVQEATVAKALEDAAQGGIDIAIQDLTKLRDEKPDSVVVRVGLARALVMKRQADAALVELRKAVELDPSSAEAQAQLGLVLHALKGDAKGALPHLEKAVAADPANTDYRTQLGAALVDLKLADRAVAELTKVTESAGYARPDGFIYLGAAQLGAKRYAAAVPPLEKAVTLAPQNAQVEAYLAWAYFGLKDSKAFVAHAGKAKALGHKEPTLLDYLARVEKGEPIK
jgi:tetratricopeptide (TPR) repeat protein